MSDYLKKLQQKASNDWDWFTATARLHPKWAIFVSFGVGFGSAIVLGWFL